jgi:hypothetical protein
MNAKPEHQEFIRHLQEAPFGLAVREEIATRRRAERQALLTELRAAERSYLEELPDLDAGIANAIAKVHETELMLQEANDMLRIANGAKVSAWAESWRLNNIYAGQLRETASPEIATFLAWISDELDAVDSTFESHQRVEKDILGVRFDRRITNGASIKARREALIAAASFARDYLPLEPDDAAVAVTIEKIKADLPTVAPVVL